MKHVKQLIGLLSLLFSFSSWAYCPIDFHTYCADLEWTDGPHLNRKSAFVVIFWNKEDSKDRPVSPHYKVSIYSWMTMDNGHDHGGPQMTVNETSPGVFGVHDARFFMHGMKGYWEVRIQLENDQETILAATKVNFDH